MSATKYVKVTWKNSTIGCREQHRKTIQALGLKHRGYSVVKEVNPAIQGMLNQVYYLIEVVPAEAPAAKA